MSSHLTAMLEEQPYLTEVVPFHAVLLKPLSLTVIKTFPRGSEILISIRNLGEGWYTVIEVDNLYMTVIPGINHDLSKTYGGFLKIIPLSTYGNFYKEHLWHIQLRVK